MCSDFILESNHTLFRFVCFVLFCLSFLLALLTCFVNRLVFNFASVNVYGVEIFHFMGHLYISILLLFPTLVC